MIELQPRSYRVIKTKIMPNEIIALTKKSVHLSQILLHLLYKKY